MKKTVSLLLMAMMLVASPYNAINALAAEETYREKVIYIRTEADWEAMCQSDIDAYSEKMDGIDTKLREDVNQFISENEMMSPLRSNDTRSVVSDDAFMEEFIKAYPEYNASKEQIKEDVLFLRANVVVTAVRAFFSSRGYDLALDLFNHSLMDDPATASLSLTGNTAGLYGHIRSELTNDPFLQKMVSFANASGTATLSNNDHTFENGDLYWAIHGFTWTRTRTSYGTASFSIDDVYDFNKWKDIPGIVAGFAGTHDFDVHIEGLVKNGSIQ